jgi:hypothetical protein
MRESQGVCLHRGNVMGLVAAQARAAAAGESHVGLGLWVVCLVTEGVESQAAERGCLVLWEVTHRRRR